MSFSGAGFGFSAPSVAPTPGTITDALNGLSENPAGTVVLGQDIGQAGNPAALISNREIPTEGFYLGLLSYSNPALVGTLNLGPVHWSIGADGPQLVTYNNETISAAAVQYLRRSAFFDRTLTIGNNANFATFLAQIQTTAYQICDAVTAFSGSYQNASCLSLYVAAGFLTGTAPVQAITTGLTPDGSLTAQLVKFLLQNGDTKNVTGFISGLRLLMETRSQGTVTDAADLILGNLQRFGVGANMVFTRKYGVYIMTIKDGANVVTGYGIYQESKNDINYFAGTLLNKKAVDETATVAQVLTETDSGKVLSNRNDAGAGVTYTLPNSNTAGFKPGTFYQFNNVTGTGLTVQLSGTDILYIGTTATSAAGTANSTGVGSSLTIVANSPGVWVAQSSTGAWVTT